MIKEAFDDNKVTNNLTRITDGEQAIDYLRARGRPRRCDEARPDPARPQPAAASGHEVLAEIKATTSLRAIPVVVLTTSAGRGGRSAQLPTARQRLRHQTGRLRPVHRCRPSDRQLLRVGRQAAEPAVTAPRAAAGFVGRSAELARLEGLLDHDPPVNVVLLHGPAGIGKSALLRELARRAGESTLVAIEARELRRSPRRSTGPGAGHRRATPARAPRLLGAPRRARRASARHVLRACRRMRSSSSPPATLPGPAGSAPAGTTSWSTCRWGRSPPTRPRRSSPGAACATPGAARRPSPGPAARHWRLRWPPGRGVAVPARHDRPAATGAVEAQLAKLLGAEPEDERRAVLAVAALARVTTPALLGAVLSDVEDAPASFAWLGEPPRDRDPERRHHRPRARRAHRARRPARPHARPRARPATAARRRPLLARGGRRPPAARRSTSSTSSRTRRSSGASRGTRPATCASTRRAWATPTPSRPQRARARVWLADARRWFDEAPDRVTVVRDEDDVIAGYGIAATPANAPAFAAEDP